MIVCVYALVDTRRPLRGLTGLRGEPLRIVRGDGVAAVVGELAHPPSPLTRNLRRYAAAVESIAARVPSILPARFGTTFDDAAELSVVLRSRAAAMRQRLRAVRGRAQMTIRIVSESESGDALFPSRSRAAGRARVRVEHKATQGTQYLRRRLQAAREGCGIPQVAQIRPVVTRLIKDERVEQKAGIVTVHHLVARGAARRYREVVERAAERNGLRLTVSGPWAPYAFADKW